MENFLNGLVAGIASDNVEKSKSLVSQEQISKVCEAINSGDLDEIDCVIFSHFRSMMDDLCNTLGLTSEAFFIVEHYGFVESNFNKIYNSYEGMACCSDKSRTVVRKLFKYLTTGKEIKFNPDAEYTFHHPKKVLNDHESIVNFFTALRNLYYGSPQQYLNNVALINKLAAKN